MTSGCQILNRSYSSKNTNREGPFQGLLWDPADAKEHGCVHTQCEAGDEDFPVSEADTKCHLQLTVEERRGGGSSW